MADRELYWGAADDAATEYRTRDSDPAGGGDFIVAERADGSEILLQWDDSASEWVSAGAVNLNGNDVTGVGALDANSISTGGATINSKPAFSGGSTSAASPGFDNWTQISADKPAVVEIRATAETDGSSNAQIGVEVDESGGTTSDYTFLIGYADGNDPSGTRDRQLSTVYVPPGAQYRITNQIDPNSGNTIGAVRELVLG